jgi:tRNA threonylcarbamoyladenosine biosynthesis protein TsaB
MNILAFDTCFDACSVAVGRGLRSLSPVIVETTEAMQTGHAERLLPMIEDAMARAGLAFSNLDRIAVSVGPGTFTGARIGVAAARALALVANVPVVTVSSLQLMAFSPDIQGGTEGTLAIATDARRGEVYFERFDRRTLASYGGPRLLTVAAAAGALGSTPALVAGSGAAAIADAAKLLGLPVRAVLPGLLPSAFDMLFRAAEFPVGPAPSPLYLRAPDAKPPAPSPFIGANA